MASVADWIEGARPRTLPAAFAPVIAGTAVAWFEHGFRPVHALLALVVALALQIGVNYANDYSDGIRGTDERRVGPRRLVGGGLASPRTVMLAAFACFGVAALAGLVLVLMTHLWWLLVVGALAIAAAWFYTGGKHPYGYAGLGELFVFVFFGLVAVCGTTLVQLGRIPWSSVAAAVAVGMLACSILVANNLRDIVGDREVGKRTLATRLGDRGTRTFFVATVAVALLSVLAVAALTSAWALVSLVFLVVVARPVKAVLDGARGPALIKVLKLTGLAELALACGLMSGLVIA